MEPVFKHMLTQAKLLSGQRKFKEAQKVYENWLENALESSSNKLDPKTSSSIALVYNNIGQLKYLNVDFDGAVEDYDKALTFNPELATAYFNRGTISYRMGYFEKARDDMERATELSPKNPEFQLGLQRTKEQLRATSNKGNVNASRDDS